MPSTRHAIPNIISFDRPLSASSVRLRFQAGDINQRGEGQPFIRGRQAEHLKSVVIFVWFQTGWRSEYT